MSATIRELLAAARRRLAGAPHRPSPREAGLLLGRVLGLGEAQLLARDQEMVPAEAEERFAALLTRRLAGEPVAYLLGEREFFGRRFLVDARVLIPRPESEHLVERALALDLPAAPRILDVGTGSGCLAVTLALERPQARVVGSDLSLGALAVAQENACRLGAGPSLCLVASNLDSALRLARFDLVVSNPPYLGREESAALSSEVRDFEPAVALFAPGRAESILNNLLAAGEKLREGAFLVFEIGWGQLAAVEGLLAGKPLRLLRVEADLAGIPRVVVLKRCGP